MAVIAISIDPSSNLWTKLRQYMHGIFVFAIMFSCRLVQLVQIFCVCQEFYLVVLVQLH